MSIILRIVKFFFFILVITVLSGIVYYNRDHYRIAYENMRVATGLDKPCSEPIIYTINRLDPGFNQSPQTLESNLSQAVSIWNAAIGKELFKYESSTTLATNNSWWKAGKVVKINLVYDNRQKSTQKLNNLSSTIESGKSSYETLKAKYNSLQENYNSQKKSLDAKIASFQNIKSAYEKDVEYWNSKGGAPKAEFAALEKRRQALNAAADSINLDNKQFNITVNNLNAISRELNATGHEINQVVSTYNDVSTSNGSEFQEGEFVSDDSGSRINIYQYSNQAKLIRVLAHEFGHALGLDHVADQKAIMYAYNLDNSIKLTADDLSALNTLCGSSKI